MNVGLRIGAAAMVRDIQGEGDTRVLKFRLMVLT
jgi:hypothetical protein